MFHAEEAPDIDSLGATAKKYGGGGLHHVPGNERVVISTKARRAAQVGA